MRVAADHHRSAGGGLDGQQEHRRAADARAGSGRAAGEEAQGHHPARPGPAGHQGTPDLIKRGFRAAQAGRKLDRGLQHPAAELGLRHDGPGRLGADPRAGGRVKGRKTRRGRLRRRCSLLRRAACAAAPPASRVLRIALRATTLRAALDPGDLGVPWGQEQRAGQGPAPAARGTTLPVAGTGAGRQGTSVNWRSIVRRSGKLHESTMRKSPHFQGIARPMERAFWAERRMA